MDVRRKFAGYASRADAESRLFGFALLEALGLPVPSDFLLIPMAQLAPARGFRYALVAALGSLVGAGVLFCVGWQVAHILSLQNVAIDVFHVYAPIFVLAAGFATIPFNVATLAAGFVHMSPLVFVGIVLVTRILRYVFISWLIWRSGSKYQEWLERSFNGMTLVLTLAVLVVSAFVILLLETS